MFVIHRLIMTLNIQIVETSLCSILMKNGNLIFRCGCDECVTSRMEDSLRHSRSRINAYRALASPSLIALSSKDPILTAFELSWELRRYIWNFLYWSFCTNCRLGVSNVQNWECSTKFAKPQRCYHNVYILWLHFKMTG